MHNYYNPDFWNRIQGTVLRELHFSQIVPSIVAETRLLAISLNV